MEGFGSKSKSLSQIIMCGLILRLSFLIQFTASQTVSTSSTRNATDSPLVASNTTGKAMEDPDDSDGDAVVIVCVLLALVIILAAIVAFLLMRKKRMSQMMDSEKKMQIQMTSARNAGVYQDLTVSTAEGKPPASPEHERLKAAEDV